MEGLITISRVAKLTGVSAKTLRYWGRIGLVPCAARSRHGYRLYGQDAFRRVEFVLKAKALGLTLGQIRQILQLVQRGQNPCPEVVRWAEQKIEWLRVEMERLRDLEQRLEAFVRAAAEKLPCSPVSPTEMCCLIEELPLSKTFDGGKADAQDLVFNPRRVVGLRR